MLISQLFSLSSIWSLCNILNNILSLPNARLKIPRSNQMLPVPFPIINNMFEAVSVERIYIYIYIICAVLSFRVYLSLFQSWIFGKP